MKVQPEVNYNLTDAKKQFSWRNIQEKYKHVG